MTPVFTKLQLRNHSRLHVLNVPSSFEPEIEALAGVEVHGEVSRGDRVGFALAFGVTLSELDDAAAGHSIGCLLGSEESVTA
jgi:hypothetical protein